MALLQQLKLQKKKKKKHKHYLEKKPRDICELL